MSENKQIGISKDDLKELLTTVIEEVRKPAPPTAKQAAELASQQEERAANGAAVKEKNERKLYFQKNICTHEHAKNDFGQTHCVWVQDNGYPGSSGYIYCQKCEGRIRPEVFNDNRDWKKLDPKAIFDTRLFNKLFQDTSQGEIISQ